jgi:inorganic triphosphatase YgiF
MRSVSNPEFEFKLELTPQQMARLASHPALANLATGQPTVSTVRSIYFDTPDHRLRAQGISLRLRSIGDKWVQAVQSSNGRGSGTGDSNAEIDHPEPSIGQIKDGKLRRMIRKAVSTSTLEPQFETIVTRTIHNLHSEKGHLELALEDGVVRAGNAEGKLCEAELGLKEGPPDCLLETASALFAQEAVKPSQTSEVERGYDLLLGRRDKTVTPLKAQIPVLRGDETCAQALFLFTDAAAEQIVRNRRALLETDDPESAHQLRIGLRRLRSAIRAFRALGDSPAACEMELLARTLGRSVGPLRNADVFIDGVLAPVAGTKKGEPGFAKLRSALEAHRAAMREQVRVVLNGEQWTKLQIHLALWPRTIWTDRSLQVPVRAFATKTLTKTWKKVAKRAVEIDDLTIEGRHDMRKVLKGFRYTCEFFGSLYPPRKVGPFIKDLKRLQDVFGYLNDVATAGELNGICHERCRKSLAAQRAVGFVLGWHDARASAAWDHVLEAWDRLESRKHFWK